MDPYNFELYRFKVGAFFSDTMCMNTAGSNRWPEACQ